MRLKYLSVIGYLMIVVSMTLLCLTGFIFASFPILIIVQILAFLLMIWARITFGRRSFHLTADPTHGGLVTNGPYRWIRHPIYASILFFILAAVFSNMTFVTAVLGCFACIGIAMRIFAEEKLIVREYPEYGEYASRTKRIVPYIF